jgi:hypothetical protein
MGKEGLTTKQRLFIEHFLGAARGNATEAARLAGYKGNDNTLSQMGAKLVRNGKIAAFISNRVTEAAMPANEVLESLSEIARAPWQQFTKVRYDSDGEIVGATLLLKDKIRALELLGKHHRLFDRAGEATDLLTDAKKAVAEFLASHPEANRAEVVAIYAKTFNLSETLISEAVN